MEMENLSPYYQEIQAVAAAAYDAGQLVTIEDVNGFPIVDVADGATFSMIIKSPKVRAAKATGVAIAGGDAVYFVAADNNVTNVASTNILIGYAAEAAASADTDIVINFDGASAFEKA